RHNLVAGVILAMLAGGYVLLIRSAAGDNPNASPSQRPHDAIADAQTPRDVPAERPEQKKTAHDLSDIFAPGKAPPTTKALAHQTGRRPFSRLRPLKGPRRRNKAGNAFYERHNALRGRKPKSQGDQAQAPGSPLPPRPKLDPVAKMSRGKPLVVGPTAKLPSG